MSPAIVPGSLEDQTAVIELPSSVFAASARDPFHPHEIVAPPGVATVPPCCPVCFTLLHAIDRNPEGDMLFECLNDV